jgi:hypothetical protein
MSEEQNKAIIYNVLQIIGGFSLFILCMICIYKRAQAEGKRDLRPSKINVIQKSSPDKIKELENRIKQLEIRI